MPTPGARTRRGETPLAHTLLLAWIATSVASVVVSGAWAFGTGNLIILIAALGGSLVLGLVVLSLVFTIRASALPRQEPVEVAPRRNRRESIFR